MRTKCMHEMGGIGWVGAGLALLIGAIGPQPAALAQSRDPSPLIRLSERNRVPACVTPARLMRFLGERNSRLEPKFRNIAAYYREHGERLKVRWDYAFYQMVIETNYLMFRNANGAGDVSPRQNNFAGIGTTGGGVPGDSFPDVSTGVLAQMQHLVAYSGETVTNPVARRTREMQETIIATSLKAGRPLTFRDLAGRWAADRKYWRSISFIAEQYQQRFCAGAPIAPEDEPPEPAPTTAARSPSSPRAEAVATASGLGASTARPAAALVAPPTLAKRDRPPCKVFTASYGGRRNVLIRHEAQGEVHFTALQVLDGQEQSLAEAFIRSHALGGQAVAQYASRDDALTGAFNRCPQGAQTVTGNR